MARNPEYQDPYKARISEELKLEAKKVGMSGVDCGLQARIALRNMWTGPLKQNLNKEQIEFLIKVDEADPEKKTPSPKKIDRQFGQRLRKKRTGNRRG